MTFTNSHRLDKAGRHLWGLPSPTPCSEQVSQCRLLITVSSWVLIISGDGDDFFRISQYLLQIHSVLLLVVVNVIVRSLLLTSCCIHVTNLKRNSSAWELLTWIHKIYVPLYLFKIAPDMFCADEISPSELGSL